MLVFTISGCDSNTIEYSDDSKEIAEFYVVNSYQYKKYSGNNLILINSKKLNCDNCYKYIYEFDIKNNLANKNIPENLKGYKMGLIVSSEDITSIEITEILN